MGKTNLFSIIDVETTGGDPRKDRITEIAIYLHDGEQVLDSFNSLINPEVPIPDFITRMTGINNEMVRDAPRFFEIARQVVEITEQAVFVAHNARFDYSFIQKEFRQLGYTYSRKLLCTLKLSRKLLPGLRSYSLKNLCKELRIDNEAAHRAWGDASATVELFEHLMSVKQSDKTMELLSGEIARAKLPPQLNRAQIDELPDETGVYYFYDKEGVVLYVGKSNQIRKRVLSHFSGAYKAIRTMKMLEQIAAVDFVVTGSELVALLLENEEIKQLQPPFNRAQRRTQFKFAIYTHENEQGYLEFAVDKYDESLRPVAGYPGRQQAEAAMDRRGRKHGLCPKLYGAERGSGRCFHYQLHICQGACIKEEAPETYNTRAQQAINALSYGRADWESFLVVGAGRDEGEVSVVLVVNGLYQGYAYFEETALESGVESICASIPFKGEAPDVQRIIQTYIKRNPREVKPFLQVQES